MIRSRLEGSQVLVLSELWRLDGERFFKGRSVTIPSLCSVLHSRCSGVSWETVRKFLYVLRDAGVLRQKGFVGVGRQDVPLYVFDDGEAADFLDECFAELPLGKLLFEQVYVYLRK